MNCLFYVSEFYAVNLLMPNNYRNSSYVIYKHFIIFRLLSLILGVNFLCDGITFI